MIRLLPLLGLLLAGCSTVPPPPAMSDDVYRAVGTEPFWSLVIEERNLVFTEANAPGVQVVQPKPRPIIGIAGEIYQTPRIGVNIVHSRCSDGMSDRIYPDKVQLRIDDRSFEGCGGHPLPPASLVNSSWIVEAVNGRPTGGGERFQLRFEGDRMSGRFGCNSISGTYAVGGTSMTAGALAMTRMACPDMSFETQAARVLAHTVELNFAATDRLTMINAAGSIVLRRVY
jgi:heat shock protein HslJ